MSFMEILSYLQEVMLTLFLSGLALIVWAVIIIGFWIVFSSKKVKE